MKGPYCNAVTWPAFIDNALSDNVALGLRDIVISPAIRRFWGFRLNAVINPLNSQKKKTKPIKTLNNENQTKRNHKIELKIKSS